MSVISLVCYILAGIIFISGVTIGAGGIIRERKRRRDTKQLPKLPPLEYEIDEQGQIKLKGIEIDEKGQVKIKGNPLSMTLEQYLLFQILRQIGQLSESIARLPDTSLLYFVMSLVTSIIVALSILIIAMVSGL